MACEECKTTENVKLTGGGDLMFVTCRDKNGTSQETTHVQSGKDKDGDKPNTCHNQLLTLIFKLENNIIFNQSMSKL